MAGHSIISCPAKIILTGEHAVVYGKSALATSVDLRTTIDLVMIGSETIKINLEQFNFRLELDTDSWPISHPQEDTPAPQLDQLDQKLVAELQDFFRTRCCDQEHVHRCLVAAGYLYAKLVRNRRCGFEMSLRSAIPVACGLGSSAALSVCLAAAFHLVDGRPAAAHSVNDWAYQAEKIFHATPSGIDNSICTLGGWLNFSQGKIKSHLDPARVAQPRILLVNTNVARQTKLLVQKVRNLHDRMPAVVEPILQAIDAVSEQTLKLMTDHSDSVDFNKIQDLLSINHNLLASLGVSHPTLDTIHRLAREDGHAAKLTGAGGGGLAFVWLKPATDQSGLDQLQEQLHQCGFTCWITKLGVQGLNIQES